MDLRSFLLNGTVLLDMEATSLENIAELILENMVSISQWHLYASVPRCPSVRACVRAMFSS